jgi:hypothetical protein
VDFYINENLGNSYLSLEYPLIHVCDSVETIDQIIDNGFRFSYCKEAIGDIKRHVELFYPIVSFSNLSWDRAIHILRTYGHSSIGMKKSWAEKSRLTPVLYFERNSHLTQTLLEGFEILKNVSISDLKSSINDQLIGERHKYYKQIIEISSFSKNFYGHLIRKEKLIDPNYCFGCESEWRAVLRHEDINPFITKDDNKEFNNSLANSHYLKFDFEDLEYFVVEKDYEEERIKEKLKSKFGKIDNDIEKIKFYYDTTRYSLDE